MTVPLISAAALGKSFPLATTPRARLGALWRLLAGRAVPRSWVLNDVSFDVAKGASLGVIGENGAGKSTLLKLLVGVFTPTTGNLRRHGTIGALLELGAGFDTERNGRENIALCAGLMGWTPRQIRERESEIIDFADIGRYIDEPVKHYSSGMVVRLGFAIVAAVRPDLLITDEVLAVGDESFQKKCVRWMEDYLASGGTLLLVSHSMYHVQKLCKQALWLRQGRVEAYGEAFEVTQAYLAYHERKTAESCGSQLNPAYRGADYRVVSVHLNGDESETPRVLGTDARLAIVADVFSPDGRRPQLGFGVLRADGSAIFGGTSEIDQAPVERVDDSRYRFRLCFELPALLPGSYTLHLHALDPEALRLFDTIERGFSIRGQARELGTLRLPHLWE